MNEFEQCIDEWAARCREKDAQITTLQAALDAERETVEARDAEITLLRKYWHQEIEKVEQLQALVRALPVPEEGGFPIVEVDGDYYVNHTSRFSTKAEADAYTGLLIYRATLDATTPAPDTSIIGKCEPPSQWGPNAQVRGDIS